MDETDPKTTGTYRAALAAVIILSLLVVLAIAGVAAGFIRQYRIYHAARAEPPHGALPFTAALPVSADVPVNMAAAATIILTPGAHIVSATSDAGKLVLHVSTPKGNEIEIIDLATGRLTAQIKEAPGTPAK